MWRHNIERVSTDFFCGGYFNIGGAEVNYVVKLFTLIISSTGWCKKTVK
jgi:hypothetical protein